MEAPRPDAGAVPEGESDVVGDRKALVTIGMAAVFAACAVFGALRFGTQVATGRATPWWGNVGGAVAIALLYAWFRARPDARSVWAVHGTALVATVALIVPAAYGITSSKWWLSLVGFSVVLMGRRREAIVWGAIVVVLLPVTALVEPHVLVANAIGEPALERATAALVFVVLLLGVTWSFRRVAQRRARELSDTAASLARASAVKNRFLAHMSHDLRTPLHGVIAMTDVALANVRSDDVREPVLAAQQSGRLLLGLLNNVIDFTRAEADALVLDRRPFLLHAALRETLAPLGAQARAKGIELHARAAPGIAESRVGDATRFTQVVLNLVGNALKFTRTGRIDVTLGASADDPDRILLEVRDTGVGIRADKVASIFEPFAQANAADARLQAGAGLGLAIVRELVRRMDGTVSVTSEEGQGSTFSVRLLLPRAEPAGAPGPEDLLHEIARPEGARVEPTAKGLRVLVCEDNPVNQKVLVAMLSRFGHHAEIAEDGARGWELLQARAYDLLVTDIEMPGIDGVALTRLVRAREREREGARLPIVCATAHVGDDERHRLLAEGIDAHLPKPFTLADLSAALERVVRPA